ncbi:MAG: 3-isopropylmalate dehydratase [Sandaracinaceae bacterium]|nr:3-isopropylmalate dehydratase [Sandaracinaceae bacterium]
MPRDAITLKGRVLYLTEDVEWIRRQLAGEDLHWPLEHALRGAISTDEITPGWVCFHYDETLGRYCLVGLAGDAITQDAIRDGGFDVIVSGRSKGCGSSRETAPFSELAAGVRVIVAESIEKIYGQNCQNIGLLTTTDFGVLTRLEAGETVPIDAFTEGLDPISADIVRAGGLFAYNRARLAGEIAPPAITTAPRAMTMVEKILARHAVVDAAHGQLGVAAVQPGDALFARADLRFAHEYVTPMADALFRAALGPDARVRAKESVVLFRDHLTFIGDVMPAARVAQGLLDKANGLATTQAEFAGRHQLRLYGESPRGGSQAICHNAVVEDLALPGQVVIGTDSHTCMAGVLGCFAFGVGSTDMANAWFTEDVRVRVPETVRVTLRSTLPPGTTAKDVMLRLLAMPFFRTSQGIGKVLEFTGEGVYAMTLDERATLTNMAVEAGGFTGIIAADELVVQALSRSRGLTPDAVRALCVTSDPGARYAHELELDLAQLRPMVASPGDPRNGRAIDELDAPVPIQIAYGGSCTGGKAHDMDLYASVFRDALARGERVAPGVACFIQYGSESIRAYAEAQGYDALFREVGATVIAPSCGACINAGPGASKDASTVTISAQNRNFPGRSGPGDVWLASPLSVAASAIAGRVVSA